jgi:hypothetical protein
MHKKKYIVFIVFYIVTMLLYIESCYSGFVTDFLGFEQNYDKCGFLHYYDCAGNPNFRYLQHAFSYVLYKTVGSDTLIWYILYALAHALTAYFFYLVLVKVLEIFKTRNANSISFIVALLFLVSPYQSEVVVWRVCIQYNTICICLLLSILLLLIDLNNKSWINPVACIVLFVIGLLSIEQVVVMPYFIMLVALAIAIQFKSFENIKRIIYFYFIPQHIVIGFYFLASKILYGKWIMHYGATAYNGFISLDTISKIFKYFFKYVFLVRFWKHEYKMLLFDFLSKPSVVIILSISLIVLILWLLNKFIKGSVNSGLFLLLIGLYIVSLSPVIQLYFSTLLLVENDRLGYLSSMFIFGIVVMLLYKLNYRLFISCAIFLIAINLFYTLKISHYWKRSTQIYNAYLQNFDAYNYQNVYFLGVPDNYKGIWMMRMYGYDSGIKEALQYRLKKPYNGNMYDVMFFNQVSFDDGMRIEKRNDSTLYVTFTHDGSWFWNQGVGATDYETPQYSVKMEQYGYSVTFKNFNKENSIILYPDKLKWQKANL